jgi:hypothetical protein
MTRDEPVVFDPDSRELAVVYLAEIDGRARRVSENVRLDAEGRIVAAEVFHGVAVASGDA